MEDQAPSFTVNEFVGSIISLDKCECAVTLVKFTRLENIYLPIGEVAR